MHLEPIRHSPANPPFGLEARSKAPHPPAPADVASVEDSPSSIQPVLSTEPPAEPEPTQPADSQEVEAPSRGVIRLLLAGHFKGVADVRLRINFHEELAAAGIREEKPVIADKVASLSETVNGYLDDIRSSDALSEDLSADIESLQEAFNSSVGSLLSEFDPAGEEAYAALSSGLRSSFEALLSSLVTLLGLDSDGATDITAESAEGSPPAEPVAVTEDSTTDAASDSSSSAGLEQDSEATPLRLIVDDLANAFSAAVDELSDVRASASLLPPLSPPQGNGTAYSKFLAVYQDMLGLAETGDPDSGLGPQSLTYVV